MAKQPLTTLTAVDCLDEPPSETSPLLPNTSTIRYNESSHDEERVDPSAYYLLPALAIGCFLGAADQTIVISSYGIIGSEMNALNKTGWLATGYVYNHDTLPQY